MGLGVVGWFIGFVSIMFIGLFGFGIYLSCLTFLISFVCGVFTILYFTYDDKKFFSVNLDCLDDPLQKTNFSVQVPKVLELFVDETKLPKFDQRITGSDTVDNFLNEILTIIINDYVTPWYEILTTDNEFTDHSIKKVVLAAGANIANRIKSVDWVHLLSTRFPEELTTHLKLFKQSQVRLKHIHLLNAKDLPNGNSRVSPKKNEEKKQTHRRNKSDTDLGWSADTQTYGKSKFYSSSEQLNGKTLTDLFFDLECSMANKQICRDTFCSDSEKENALLCEVSESVLYLVAPEEAWKCHALKLILIDLLSGVILRPLINLLSDPDCINRVIIRNCCRDSILPSDVFLMVIRSSDDAEELDAILELVQKEKQKLHSRDTAGGLELPVRQQLSSLQYLTRIIQARRAMLGPQEDAASSSDVCKVSEEVTRSLQFLKSVTAWRSNAEYWKFNFEIDLIEKADSSQSSKAMMKDLRSSALEICDTYLGPNKPLIVGLTENCYADLVRKIATDGDKFTNNPVDCFDDVQKGVEDALAEMPEWQAGYMHEDLETNASSDFKKDDRADNHKYSAKCKKLMKCCLNQLPKLFHKSKFKYDLPNKSSTFPRSLSRNIPFNKNHTLPKCKCRLCGDILPVPEIASRHSRSRSDIVGVQRMVNECAGTSNLASTSNLSFSHSEIRRNSSASSSYLTASIFETALVQDKGRTFGIYAIVVTRLSDNEKWHIYRRYSDFYDLHCSIKEKWQELGQLPFPGKKTFQNTSRMVLERRKIMLNSYLQSLITLTQEGRYRALLGEDYLGGFLSPENHERQSNTIDAFLVNSLRAGMRTLKNMPDQFANTVDGVMDGISKVFQGKSGENYSEEFKVGSGSDTQDDGDESVALKLFEEVLGIQGLWLRRRLLAPLRTLIADRVNRKVLEFVSSLTSPPNVVMYLKSLKQWLTSRGSQNYGARDQATKARTRVAAKVALLTACSDDLKHIVGSDTARRGLLTVFDLFQTQEINKRLIFVLLEAMLINLFPDNKIQELFRTLYTSSPRVPSAKRSVNI